MKKFRNLRKERNQFMLVDNQAKVNFEFYANCSTLVPPFSSLQPPLPSSFRFFAGKAQKTPHDALTSASASASSPSSSKRWRCLEAFGLLSRLRSFLSSLRHMARHSLCQHADSCLYHSLQVSAPAFHSKPRADFPRDGLLSSGDRAGCE